jgi:hypothetical protein
MTSDQAMSSLVDTAICSLICSFTQIAITHLTVIIETQDNERK